MSVRALSTRLRRLETSLGSRQLRDMSDAELDSCIRETVAALAGLAEDDGDVRNWVAAEYPQFLPLFDEAVGAAASSFQKAEVSLQ